MIVVSLPFLGIGKLLSLIIGWEYAQIFGVFLTSSYPVFLIFFVSGIILISVGIVLKFLSAGRTIGNIFGGEKEKVSKKGIKEEIRKELKVEKVSKKKK